LSVSAIDETCELFLSNLLLTIDLLPHEVKLLYGNLLIKRQS
jgi:hypothetical protein